MLEKTDPRRIPSSAHIETLLDRAAGHVLSMHSQIEPEKSRELVISDDAFFYFRELEDGVAKGDITSPVIKGHREELARKLGLANSEDLLEPFEASLIESITAYQEEHPKEAPAPKPEPAKMVVRHTLITSLPRKVERDLLPEAVEGSLARKHAKEPKLETFSKQAILAFQKSAELKTLVGAIQSHAQIFGPDKDAPDPALDDAKKAAASLLNVSPESTLIISMVRAALSAIDGSAAHIAEAMQIKPDSPNR